MKWGEVKKMILKYEILLKWGLFLVVSFLLYHILDEKKSEFQYIDWEEFLIFNFLEIIVVIFLSILNWGLEARKWQILTVGNNFFAAYRAVLTGVAFKQFIPFGEISGRMLITQPENKKEDVVAYMISGFFQFMITILFGLYGIFWLIYCTKFIVESYYLWILSVTMIIFVLIFLFRKPVIIKINKWFFNLKTLKIHTLKQLFLISFFRYLVFFTQAFILFSLFNPLIEVNILCAGITFIYLSKTILPSFGFLGDLGIREISAAFFFSQFGLPIVPVIIASLSVWVVNIFLPSIFALLFFYKLKFR